MATVVTEESNLIQETQFTQPLSPQENHNNFERTRQSLRAQNSTPETSNTNTNGHVSDTGGARAEQIVSKPINSASARALAPDLLRGLLMVLQAVDHAAVTSNAWPHGVAVDSGTDTDGGIVKKWNDVVPWTARMLTHLCAPGFMFLLGMGVVYFGRSRTKLGWGAGRMTRHFAVRAVVLAGINELLTLGIIVQSGFKTKLRVLNIVLLALAFNYFIAGMVWQFLNWTEQMLTRALVRAIEWKDGGDDALRQPLLQNTESELGPSQDPAQTRSRLAATISWHVHTSILVVLSIITISWNIWLSPTHGHCTPGHASPLNLSLDSPSQHTALFEFLFHVFANPAIVSPFPPLAWLSFAILGLLYARIILSRPFRPRFINLINFLLGLFFLLIFVMTRLLHFGNLSENCLNMPEQKAHPDHDQYLASFRSFFYTTKYPPDVAFMGYTMGLNFLFLSLFGFVSARTVTRVPFSILLTYGTSALFFYTLHLPIYTVLGVLAKMWFGRPVDFNGPGEPSDGDHVAYGTGYGVVFWGMWLVGLAILWPLCLWYGNFKRRQGPESIWRFF